MIYPPKRDLWLVMIILLVGLIFFGLACFLLVKFILTREPLLWVPALIMAAVGGLLMWFMLGTYYEITDKDLLIRLGPLRWKLSLETIVDVYSTTRLQADFGWGLAWSMDRLRIKCRGRVMPFWISPEDKAAFIAELVRVRPGLNVTEDR